MRKIAMIASLLVAQPVLAQSIDLTKQPLELDAVGQYQKEWLAKWSKKIDEVCATNNKIQINEIVQQAEGSIQKLPAGTRFRYSLTVKSIDSPNARGDIGKILIRQSESPIKGDANGHIIPPAKPYVYELFTDDTEWARQLKTGDKITVVGELVQPYVPVYHVRPVGSPFRGDGMYHEKFDANYGIILAKCKIANNAEVKQEPDRKAAEAPKQREIWAHDAGYFVHGLDKDWFEKWDNGRKPTLFFQESDRNDSYIELKAVGENKVVRLYADRCDVFYKSNGFKTYYTGKWAK
jgi:hypothetical protein